MGKKKILRKCNDAFFKPPENVSFSLFCWWLANFSSSMLNPFLFILPTLYKECLQNQQEPYKVGFGTLQGAITRQLVGMKLLSFSFLVGIMGIITSILSSICED
jgi:hypothetical protein